MGCKIGQTSLSTCLEFPLEWIWGKFWARFSQSESNASIEDPCTAHHIYKIFKFYSVFKATNFYGWWWPLHDRRKTHTLKWWLVKPSQHPLPQRWDLCLVEEQWFLQTWDTISCFRQELERYDKVMFWYPSKPSFIYFISNQKRSI